MMVLPGFWKWTSDVWKAVTRGGDDVGRECLEKKIQSYIFGSCSLYEIMKQNTNAPIIRTHVKRLPNMIRKQKQQRKKA